MIYNKNQLLPTEIRHLAYNPNWTFYPTGSRVFGHVTNTSDWDFFARHDDALERYLKDLGFQNISPCYQDKLTKAVYRKNKTDIQLVSDTNLKLQAQVILLNSKFPLHLFNKEQRRYLWDSVIELAKG
jgi:hypothetical protein